MIQSSVAFNPNLIELDDRELIERVSSSLLGYDAWTLVDRTHEEKPWKNTQRFDIISNESIEEYFRVQNNKCRIFGD